APQGSPEFGHRDVERQLGALLAGWHVVPVGEPGHQWRRDVLDQSEDFLDNGAALAVGDVDRIEVLRHRRITRADLPGPPGSHLELAHASSRRAFLGEPTKKEAADRVVTSWAHAPRVVADPAHIASRDALPGPALGRA